MRKLLLLSAVLCSSLAGAQITGTIKLARNLNGPGTQAPLYHLSWAASPTDPASFGLRSKPAITLRAPSLLLLTGTFARITVEAETLPGRGIKLVLFNARCTSPRYVFDHATGANTMVMEAVVQYDEVWWKLTGFSGYGSGFELTGTTGPVPPEEGTATAVGVGPVSATVGTLDQTVVAGEEAPLTFQIKPLEAVESLEWDGQTRRTSERDQIYKLTFTVENSSKADVQIAWDAATMTLVSADGTRVPYVQAFVSPSTGKSVVQALPPKEKMTLFTVFEAPKGFRPTKLVIERERKRYEVPVNVP